MLIDRVLESGHKGTEYLDTFVVFDVTNVARYYYEGNDKEVWGLADDFPNIAPPFSRLWFEYAPSKIAWSDGRRVETSIGQLVRKCGVAMECFALDDVANMPEREAEVWQRLVASLSREPRWLCSAGVVMEGVDKNIAPFPGIAMWGVSEDGSYLGKNGMLHCIAPQPVSDFYGNTFADELGLFLHIPFLALSFLHCRNVKIVEPLPNPKWDRARMKSGKKPLVRYETLEIEPMKRVLKEQGERDTKGLKHALHICRGHFKDFSEGGGLFGKYHGMYWWESQVRGRASEGIVVKDYSVVAS